MIKHVDFNGVKTYFFLLLIGPLLLQYSFENDSSSLHVFKSPRMCVCTHEFMTICLMSKGELYRLELGYENSYPP